MVAADQRVPACCNSVVSAGDAFSPLMNPPVRPAMSGVAGLPVPAGTYTLWTVPHADGRVDLIVNQQTGQWGTEYGRAHDLGTVAMKSETVDPPVEQFTIAIQPSDAGQGKLVMSWGTFRWTAPIVVQ